MGLPVLCAILALAFAATPAIAQRGGIEIESLPPPEAAERAPEASRDDSGGTTAAPDQSGSAAGMPPSARLPDGSSILPVTPGALEVTPLPEDEGNPGAITRGIPEPTAPGITPERALPGVRPGEGRRPIPIGGTEPQPGARLRMLDMITGRTETFDVSVREETVLQGRLALRLLTCKTPLDAAGVGDIALLEINDRRSEGEAPDFSGWMFADSPALSALDHPRYDVWLISCITRDGEASASIE